MFIIVITGMAFGWENVIAVNFATTFLVHVIRLDALDIEPDIPKTH